MMPTTVPNRPMNGALAPTVPSTQSGPFSASTSSKRFSSVRSDRYSSESLAVARQHVGEDAAGRRRHLAARGLQRLADLALLEARADAAGQVQGLGHQVAQRPQALEDDADGDDGEHDQRIGGEPPLLDHFQNAQSLHGTSPSSTRLARCACAPHRRRTGLRGDRTDAPVDRRAVAEFYRYRGSFGRIRSVVPAHFHTCQTFPGPAGARRAVTGSIAGARAARHRGSFLRLILVHESRLESRRSSRLSRRPPSTNCGQLEMHGIARLTFSGGERLMPARNGYDRELVFDEAEFCAKRHGEVRLELSSIAMLIRAGATRRSARARSANARSIASTSRSASSISAGAASASALAEPARPFSPAADGAECANGREGCAGRRAAGWSPSSARPRSKPSSRRRTTSACAPAWCRWWSARILLGLKYLAYQLTGSTAILSDALESIVNVIAALFGLGRPRRRGLAGRPQPSLRPRQDRVLQRRVRGRPHRVRGGA